jgi:hypothetical protein
MNANLNDQALHVLELAEQQARGLNHAYVGTEHILLALAADESNIILQALQSFGVDLPRLLAEIERLIQRGDNPPTAATLPLTPRARRVIDCATNEAKFMNEKSAGPEHLLLGLFREPDGVAGHALRNLGLELGSLAKEVFRTRLEQMKTVERAVRPVRATTTWKRKTREELLAHLVAIYDAETSRLTNSAKAMQAAVNRFGDPTELARELESSLSASERRGYVLERWLGWQAPESAERYMFRQAIYSFAALAIIGVVGFIIAVASRQLAGIRETWHPFRATAAFLTLVPVCQFLLGLLFFKLRDAIFGPAWARKSLPRAFAFGGLIAVVTFIGAFGFTAISNWSVYPALAAWPVYLAIAIAVSLTQLAIVLVQGPLQIRDTLWACLDIGEPRRTEFV